MLPARPTAMPPPSANGSKGVARMVAGMPSMGICLKLRATRGNVARVAAIDTIAAANSQPVTTPIAGPRDQLLCSKRSAIPWDTASCQGKARTMPVMAAKLSWKEIWEISFGSRAVIRIALNASAGARLSLGLPKPNATKKTLPMIAALMTDAGAPLIRT